MPRYKLRTLLILLAVLPPLLWFGWGQYQAWKAEQERKRIIHRIIWSPDGKRLIVEEKIIVRFWGPDGAGPITARTRPTAMPKESQDTAERAEGAK